MSVVYGVARSIRRITLVLFCVSPVYLQTGVMGEQLDVDEVDEIVSSYVTSLESLRKKPLRIKAKSVPSSIVLDFKALQTLLMDGGKIRLETMHMKGDVVVMHGETSIFSNRYIRASNHKKKQHPDGPPRLSLTSYLKTPENCFNRTIAPFWGSDYLGFSSLTWRTKCHDIVQLLPTLKLVGRYDTIDGMDVVELQGTSEDVSLTMWIAPSLNYALKKIEYRPSIPDNVTAEDINRVPSHKLHISVFNQFKKLADNYVPQQIDVHFLASGYYLRDGKVHPSPRKPIDAKFDVSWSVEVVSAPLSDDDFKVSMEIPDGTRVQMDDAPSLNYVWRNGEVVPSKE